MSIVLIGYRGSGKTTVGRLLCGFVDTDEQIIRRAGKSIKAIFADHGEITFRDFETEVVREVAALANHVIALGGGALGRTENLAAISAQKHHLIHLSCEPHELLRRIESDPATVEARPALTRLGGGIEEIQRILGEREPIWRKAMSAEVDVTRLSPPAVVEAIMKLI